MSANEFGVSRQEVKRPLITSLTVGQLKNVCVNVVVDMGEVCDIILKGLNTSLEEIALGGNMRESIFNTSRAQRSTNYPKNLTVKDRKIDFKWVFLSPLERMLHTSRKCLDFMVNVTCHLLANCFS